ncbi:class I SAM-dependent methyltransferase [Exiguobacterium sp. RIT594]|uniref:class I SAM-dependent methyltransferase n=2 Tax=unclassified Exiguobacterium TaxID=2644629 RepID=UPI001F27F49E|nr:class I SAM-dependent methyltransferase [Exiguobacterium sp. RIT594]
MRIVRKERITIIASIKRLIDQQYAHPTGRFGTYIGEKMVRQHQPETEWTIELLTVQKDDSILELGCGAGYAIERLVHQTDAKQITGIDSSSAMLRSVQKRNKEAIQSKRVHVLYGDLNKLAFQSEQFDKVFTIHTLYFWENISGTLAALYHALKPGGHFVITFCDGKNDVIWAGVRDLVQDELLPAARKHGFSDISFIEGPVSRQFRNVAVRGHKPFH